MAAKHLLILCSCYSSKSFGHAPWLVRCVVVPRCKIPSVPHRVRGSTGIAPCFVDGVRVPQESTIGALDAVSDPIEIVVDGTHIVGVPVSFSGHDSSVLIVAVFSCRSIRAMAAESWPSASRSGHRSRCSGML